MTGTAALVRLALRLDRVRIPVWVLAIAALVLVTAASIRGLYPTPADLAAAAAVVADNPTAVVMNGPPQGLDTLGGRIAFEVGAFGAVVVALMSVLLVGRHTRADEESGRTELVLAAAVGRHAPLAAALIVAAIADVTVALVVAGGLIATGLPVAGSLALGAVLGGTGLVFAGVTAVAAQITEHARGVIGLAVAVLGLAFVLRAAGDVGDGTLSWFSPIGLLQQSRPFAGERFWPVLVALGLCAVLVAVAVALASRRDVGAGLVRPRPGPATAGAGLRGPLSLAVRLQRGSVVAWSAALFAVGVAYGSIAQDIGDFVGDSEQLGELLAGTGGAAGLVDAFLGTSLLMLSLIGSGFAVASALRARTEETAGRAEPVLAGAVSRTQWAGSQLAVALAGSAVVLAAGGLGTGLAYGLSTGDPGQVPRLLGAALVPLPAVWVLIGLAALLLGVAPRATAVAWAAFAACLVVTFLGPLLELPSWAAAVSPFDHVRPFPDLALGGPAVLLAVAGVLIAAGLAGFRRRDVG